MFNLLDGWLGFLLSVLLIAFFVSINEKLNRILRKIDSVENKGSILKNVSASPIVKQALIEELATTNSRESIKIKSWEYNPIAREAPTPTSDDRLVAGTQVQTQSYPDVFQRFGAWLKDDWAMKLGAFFLLLAFIWFAEYAIQENWIGEVGRITLGVITGFIVMLFGWLDIRKNFNQGSIFFVLGSSISIATLSVSRVVYPEMINPVVASILMFIFSAFVSIVAISYKNKALAVISICVMGAVPLLLNSTGSLLMLFAYLLAVILGSICVSWLMNFKLVIVISQIFVLLYSISALMNRDERHGLLPMIYIFIGTFFVSHILGFVRRKLIDNTPDILIGVLNSLLLFIWVVVAVNEEWQSIIFLVWAALFVFGAYTISKIIKDSIPYYLYAVIGAGLLVIATAVQFDGPMLAIAFAAEAGIVVFASYKIHKNLAYSSELSALFIVPFLLGIQSIYSRLWDAGILHTPFFTTLFLFLIPVLLGTYFYLEKSMNEKMSDENISTFRTFTISLLVAGTFYGFVFVWKVLHATLSVEYLSVLWSLVIYTIVGLIGYFSGLKNKANVLIVSSTVVLALVAARLLLVDVWEMAIGGRFLTFLVIGILFIMSAFYTRKLKREEMYNEPVINV